VGGDEPLELGDQPGVPAAFEVGRDAVFEDGEPLFFEPAAGVVGEALFA